MIGERTLIKSGQKSTKKRQVDRNVGTTRERERKGEELRKIEKEKEKDGEQLKRLYKSTMYL